MKYKVTAKSQFAFESVVNGDSGVTPDTSAANHTAWSWIGTSVPQGTTVKDITNLTANFTWQFGENHSGGFRWQISTPDGQMFVYYGDPSTSLQSGTDGSGVNMIALGGDRVEISQLNQNHNPLYDTWTKALADHATASGTLIADEPVSSVSLTIDGGWGDNLAKTSHDQVLNLSTASVNGNVFTWPAATAGQTDNSQPAWISLSKMSGNTPLPPIDEQLITSTQGDSGGQFRQIDSMYMYNLPVSNLPDKAATYQVGISFNENGSAPVGVVQFGLK